jgi:hypothetical protein
MNVTEERLAAVLHDLTPDPPRQLTGADVRARGAAPHRRGTTVGRRPAAWFAPVAAGIAAMVLVLGVVAVVPRLGGSRPDGQSGPAPTPGCPSTEPVPSAHTPSALLLDGTDLGGSWALFPQPAGGISNLVYSGDAAPQWDVLEQGQRFADPRSAQAYAQTLVATAQCRVGGQLVRPSGAALPQTWFLQIPPSTSPDGTPRRQVVTAVGDDVLDVSVGTSDTAHPDADPGDAFLVSLAAAVRAKAAGQPVPHVVPPQTLAPPPPPTGFLTVSDLGSGWAAGSYQGDSGPVTQANVPHAGSCDGVSVPLAESGQHVTYRGHQPLGDGEWLLDESVVRLTSAGVTQARTALSQAATGCASERTLFSGAGIAGDYALALRPKDEAGYADAYVLVGDRLLHLQTLPGGASGQQVPLPGGTTWLRDTARTAADRLSATPG